MSLNPADVRVFVYRQLIEEGSMPSLSDIGAHFGASERDARDTIAGARLGKTLLPDPRTGEIWMAGPFAARPTTYRLSAGSRTWWANCAWDMLGVAALVQGPIDVAAQCTDCGDPIAMRLDPEGDPAEDFIVHFLVPARRWYDDIGFT